MGWGWLPEDRAERIGLIVSGVGHLALILWALLGGIFFTPDASPPVQMAEVSLMSSDEFAALAARAPTAATDSPAQPSAPLTSEAPPPKPKKQPKPEPSEPAPQEEQPAPDVAPDVAEVTPPTPDTTDTPPEKPLPPAEDQLVDLAPTDSQQPTPKSAPRVAPDPTETPKPDAEVSDTVTEQTSDQPAPETPPEEKPKVEAAPEDAGQVLETEANKDNKEVGSAPKTSPQPKPKPKKKPAPAPEEPAPDAPETDAIDTQTATADTATDDAAVNDALAEALSGAASEEPSAGTGVADSGPPLTSGEKDGLILAIKACWNVGSLSTDALHTVVTIGVSMGQDGKPDAGSIKLISSEGGDDTSTRQAFEAGRRAIIRCAKEGYDLPAEKYGQWQNVEIVFNPAKMRMR